MRRIFLGKPIHWILLLVVAFVLWWLGTNFFHTRNYNQFLVILFLLVTGLIGALILTTRSGEQVTREPFDDAPEE